MKLDLTWTAFFEDGKRIPQFEDLEQKNEHLFKEILDYQEKSHLLCFVLTNNKTHRDYSVDLVNGRLYVRNSIFSSKMPPISKPEVEVEVCGTNKYKYRLIYFRRVTREMTWAGKEMFDRGVKDIQYFLGFQYTNEKDENVKRLLQISKTDEVYLT